MSDARSLLLDILSRDAVRELPDFVDLASGDRSRYYVNIKRALASGDALRLAGQVMVETAAEYAATFDVAGGLSMGADPLAHAVAMETGKSWFAVRKEAKAHGEAPGRAIEGAILTADQRVLLVDDVVTRGGSILKALDAVEATGALVALALTLVDRGRATEQLFAERGVPYRAVYTFADLGIPAVGEEVEPERAGATR